MTILRRLAAACVGLPALVGGVAIRSAPAQEIVRARYEIDLGEEARARVKAHYELRGGTSAVPLELTTFGDTRVEGGAVRWASGEVVGVVDLERLRPRIFQASLGSRAAEGDSLLRLDLEYAVLGAREDDGRKIRWRIPLVRAGDGLAQALPGTFTAEVRLPPGVEAYESFPTGLRTVENGADGERARVDLQVVPAVVTLRARRGGPPLLPPLKLLDGAVVLFLLALGGAGWRWLGRRREAA